MIYYGLSTFIIETLLTPDNFMTIPYCVYLLLLPGVLLDNHLVKHFACTIKFFAVSDLTGTNKSLQYTKNSLSKWGPLIIPTLTFSPNVEN